MARLPSPKNWSVAFTSSKLDRLTRRFPGHCARYPVSARTMYWRCANSPARATSRQMSSRSSGQRHRPGASRFGRRGSEGQIRDRRVAIRPGALADVRRRTSVFGSASAQSGRFSAAIAGGERPSASGRRRSVRPGRFQAGPGHNPPFTCVVGRTFRGRLRPATSHPIVEAECSVIGLSCH